MSEENISIFRQELERVKTQFEDKFQDIMASVRADRENDKRTLQMVNENINNDRKAINQNRALNDKLETLLNVQNTMLSELRSMNNSIKDLSGGGGGLGGILAAGGAAAAAGAGLTAAGFFGMGGDTDPAGNGGGTRDTGGGERPIVRTPNIRPRTSDVTNETVQSTKDRISERIGREISEEEFRALVGITSSEGGEQFGPEESAAIIATVINRFEQTKQATGNEDLTLTDIIFADRQFTPATGALTGYSDVMAGHDEAGLRRFTEAYAGNPDNSFVGGVEAFLDNPDAYEGINYFAARGVPHIGTPVEGVGGGGNVFRVGRGGDFSSGGRGNFDLFLEYLRENNIDIRGMQDNPSGDIESDAERVEGDGVTELLNRFNIDPNSLRFDEEGRLKNELYDTEGYPIRLSPKDAEELSQGLGIELPSSMEELRSDLASRDVAVEYEDRFSPGTPTSSNTEELIGRSNETIRKYYAERLGLPEDISMKEIREYMLENDISSAPALKSVMIGRGGVEDIGGLFRDLEDVASRVQPASGPHRTVSGLPAEHMDYSQGLLAAKLTEGSPLTEYLAERETLDGGGGDDIIDGGDGRDTLDPQDTPLGPRIPEENPTEPTEETPTGFPTLFEQFERGESPTSMTGMELAPPVVDALAPDLPEPPAEEDPRETTRETPSGGYTGGGGGSSEQEQPQIESNAIGRFPWAEKIIKYYNLSDMIKTNMLS